MRFEARANCLYRQLRYFLKTHCKSSCKKYKNMSRLSKGFEKTCSAHNAKYKMWKKSLATFVMTALPQA